MKFGEAGWIWKKIGAGMEVHNRIHHMICMKFSKISKNTIHFKELSVCDAIPENESTFYWLFTI